MDLYKHHPAADVFPMMSEAELAALAEDIRKNGLEEFPCLWRGMLLDGRNRQEACRRINLDFGCSEIDDAPGFDPIAFVITKNIHRRHLTESQRAMVAAKLATMKLGDNQHSTKEGLQICRPSADAAVLLNVSTRSVDAAKSIIAKGSQAVIDAVQSGSLSVSAAEKLVKAEPDKRKQAAVVKQGKAAVRDAIKANAKPRPAKVLAVAETAIHVEDNAPDEYLGDVDYELFNDFRVLWMRLKEHPATMKHVKDFILNE